MTKLVPISALVLTAGLGTRLEPLTLARAKPAIPVAGEPLIRRILRWLRSSGVTNLVLNLHHLPETIGAIVGDGGDLGVRVRYSWEQPDILGSGGGPRQALPILEERRFFVINGDTLTNLDLRALAVDHDHSGASVTLALTVNRAPDKYGGVRLAGDGRVTGFVPRGSTEASYHFFGVQIVEAGVFAPLCLGTVAQTVGGVYDAFIRDEPGAVRGFLCDARSWDIGTPLDYWTTAQDLLRAERGADSVQGRNVRVDGSARVTRSMLWDDVELGAGAVLDECIVTDRVRIPPGARYRRSMIVQPKHAPTGSLVVATFP